MPKTAEDAKLQVEQTSTLRDFNAGADSGDQKKFVFTGTLKLFSLRKGLTPIIRPDGVISGFEVTPAGTNDDVDVSAGKVYLAGVETSVAASNEFAMTRPATLKKRISLVVVTAAGAIDEVEGADGDDFSAVRGAAGGPPLVPVGNVELAQVELTEDEAALVLAADINQAETEKFDEPAFKVIPGESI